MRRWSALSYDQLISRLSTVDVYEIEGDFKKYQVEIETLDKTEEYVHVAVSVDGGHLKLPAMYFERYFVAAGGLVSYGPDFIDQYRAAAGYVDRILKGEKPTDLPVQVPTKYELGQSQDRESTGPSQFRRPYSPVPTTSLSRAGCCTE
jgi:hypothetical protein